MLWYGTVAKIDVIAIADADAELTTNADRRCRWKKLARAGGGGIWRRQKKDVWRRKRWQKWREGIVYQQL
jgi:hypothetical protein